MNIELNHYINETYTIEIIGADVNGDLLSFLDSNSCKYILIHVKSSEVKGTCSAFSTSLIWKVANFNTRCLGIGKIEVVLEYIAQTGILD